MHATYVTHAHTRVYMQGRAYLSTVRTSNVTHMHRYRQIQVIEHYIWVVVYMEYTHVDAKLSEKVIVMQLGYEKYLVCSCKNIQKHLRCVMYICTYVSLDNLKPTVTCNVIITYYYSNTHLHQETRSCVSGQESRVAHKCVIYRNH